MAVASPITVGDVSRHLKPLVRKLKATQNPDPAALAMRYAQVKTEWGSCGLLWRLTACPWPWSSNPDEGAFAQAPVDALLCQIIGPGLPPANLRTVLKRKAPWASEVLPGTHDTFPTQVVPPWFEELREFLCAYFAKEAQEQQHDIPTNTWQNWRPHLDIAALSEFQIRVLDQVAQIPRGQVRTYGQIAKAVGQPNSARAVGSVMRLNPWPILIPCHRVVGASGALTGYSGPGELATKERLLALEQAILPKS